MLIALWAELLSKLLSIQPNEIFKRRLAQSLFKISLNFGLVHSNQFMFKTQCPLQLLSYLLRPIGNAHLDDRPFDRLRQPFNPAVDPNPINQDNRR